MRWRWWTGRDRLLASPTRSTWHRCMLSPCPSHADGRTSQSHADLTKNGKPAAATWVAFRANHSSSPATRAVRNSAFEIAPRISVAFLVRRSNPTGFAQVAANELAPNRPASNARAEFCWRCRRMLSLRTSAAPRRINAAHGATAISLPSRLQFNDASIQSSVRFAPTSPGAMSRSSMIWSTLGSSRARTEVGELAKAREIGAHHLFDTLVDA